MDSRATEREILELENKLLHPTAEPISLPLSFLRLITGDFCDEQELGRGGYGVVYKGRLPCGLIVAVKKFSDIVVDDDQFQKEATFLIGIQHQNVVRILGYCAESRWETMEVEKGKGRYVLAEIRARMLCFEYMCNKGLDEYLSDESSGLEWNTRYEIIKGICNGLNFLHECNIVHLDLKPQNILMDTNMMPKIADFGLSRLLGKQKSYIVTVNRVGTRGYMAPEHLDKGVISNKADIFSFGVIVIEILRGCKDDYPDYRRSTKTDFQNFTEKVLGNWRNRFGRASNYTELELHTQQVKQCINIALQCVHPDKERRPNTSKIIEIINAEEGSCCVLNVEDLLRETHDVQHEHRLVALNRSIMKDYTPERTAEDTRNKETSAGRAVDMVKSVVAPPIPQCEPVLAYAQHNKRSLAALNYQGARNASFCVAHKALASLKDNLLHDWATANNLGPNIKALQLEMLSVKAILESTLGKVILNSALEDSLMMLQDLVYGAEDVLDEMEYFRIHDMLGFDADDQHANVRTQNPSLIEFPCSPLPSVRDNDDYDDDDNDSDYDSDDYEDDHDDNDNYYDISMKNLLGSYTNELAELKFNRVNATERMQHIVDKMQLLQQKVSGIITPLGPNWSTIPNIAQSRPSTTSQSIVSKFYGRKLMMDGIIHDITKGKHSAEVLTVIPIVGPGGIGKTTLAQHIYHNGEVQKHFHVTVWTCVSLNFNVNKIIEDIQRYIRTVYAESNGTGGDLIGQTLKNKRLLLVLDDIWDCSDDDEWKQLLVPFKKSKVQGNIIIVTTRFPAQAQIMVQKNYHSIHLQGIENEEFKELFMEIVFGDDDESRKDHIFLHEIGFRIAGKLKGSPLAAKTVGRLLRTKLDFDHWTGVLESREWEQSNNKNDIMPALKLSFDYLPSQLQQCFSFCALFPQDYIFKTEELINFWIGQEVLHSLNGENKRVEDIGLSHLTDLVNYGFLDKKAEQDARNCYIIHDLLHELARNVSSLECLSIDNSQSQVSLKVLPSIRHLSINIHHTSVKDRFILKNCVDDFNTLETRLKVQKLRTLMIFGEHHDCFVKAFGDLFREAKALRVIFLSKVSYDVEYLLCNFYNLLHLRYLRIESSFPYQVRFPNKISRFYHMMVLDVKQCGKIIDLPRNMNKLVKLRHFLVQNDATHSSIAEVGKLKSLQELRRFVVKREAQGFELREIGHLAELSGSLSIYNLENVQVKEEVGEAKLVQKSRIRELILHWKNICQSANDSKLDNHVLERLKPNNNLLKLSVKGHRGSDCPSWLGRNLSITSLESLCLDGVAWKTFPPIGELWLVNVPCEEIADNIPEKRFVNLKRIELCRLKMIEKWAVHAPCQLFPFLEVLIINGCPKLLDLSFQHFACCQQGKEVNANLFPSLSRLEIRNCPQLMSFPPVPWTEAPCSTIITGISSLAYLFCGIEHKSSLNNDGKDIREYVLSIEGKTDTPDHTLWNVLAFHNLTGLTGLNCREPPLRYLQMLPLLRTLEMSCSSNAFPFVEGDNHMKYQFPVELLTIPEWCASGKELTQLLTYFTKLSNLQLCCLSEEVTELAVNVKEQRATETPGSSYLGKKVNLLLQKHSRLFLKKKKHPRPRAKDEIIASEAQRGLLLLPPQLQELRINQCPELSLLHSNSGYDHNQDGRTGGRPGGLQGLTSLRVLITITCPKLLLAYTSSFSSGFPFPNSLEYLDINGAVGMNALVPLSNLTFLKSLFMDQCGDSRGEGLFSLLAQGHLTELTVLHMPNLFVDSELSLVHEQEIPSCSSKLHALIIDDVAGFSAMAIRHNLLFSSLTRLEIWDKNVEHLTEEQEALLFVNSLEDISLYSCDSLQCLPARLCILPRLKRLRILECETIQMPPEDALPGSLQDLEIDGCPEIRSLPKVCFPSSLQKLVISSCQAIQMLPEDTHLSSLQKLEINEYPEIQSLSKDYLPDSLQKLVIRNCPDIRSLPEVDDLPSSLREIDVRDSESEDLRSHCCKLINIIPIVIA